MVRSRNASRSIKRVRSFNKIKNQKSKSLRKRTFKRKKGGSEKQGIKPLNVLENELKNFLENHWTPDEFMKSLFKNFAGLHPYLWFLIY